MAASSSGVDSFAIEKLRYDLQVLAGDMEQLLKATANQTGQQIAQVRAKAEESLSAARVRMAEVQESAMAKTRAAGRATDEYVHANPWQMLAVAAAVGLAFGFAASYFSGSSDSES
jgi:ElaB/YqjD/DUF883 family membrane-anchored ribosome-binding protein